MTEVVVVGAGGFGREVLDVIDALRRATESVGVLGIVDDDPRPIDLARLDARGVPFLGSADRQSVDRLGSPLVVGVGSPQARASLFERFAGLTLPTLIHPTATVGSQVVVEAGTVICAGVSVGTNVTLGRGCHLNPNATIGHDTVIGDFVSVNPMANVSGECRIGERTLVGASAILLQGLTVGRAATIGAGSVVVRNVPANVVVKGVPGRW